MITIISRDLSSAPSDANAAPVPPLFYVQSKAKPDETGACLFCLPNPEEHFSALR